MGTPYSLPTADGSRGKTLRAARPDRTNATLVSPETSRIVNAKTSPSKALPLSKAEVTTDNLLKTACNHLITVDPKLKAVIDKHPCPVFSPEGLAEKIDPFKSLTSGIIAQQLCQLSKYFDLTIPQVSGAAAKAIKTRFVALFNEDSSASEELVDSKFPHPSQVAACDETRLRSAGLSARKAEYIKGLSEKFVSGELSTEMLLEATDDEVMEKLIAVKGLGKWSVEMFACFALKRMDILSTGDLGVQRGMAAYVGKDVSKLKAKGGGKWKYMSEQDMLDISARFSPYRSLFMWYMWRIEGVDVSAVQDN
ncbi:MAG: hypothetical protein M1825_003309 [Sarcosagium campestre]|nr:MAG: hypothetical protein M1825_003309 [Sarcosagium campestre]